MDLLRSPSPASSCSGGGSRHLQAVVSQLQAENAALRDDLQRSASSRSAAAAASASLQSIAQGLQGISDGDGEGAAAGRRGT